MNITIMAYCGDHDGNNEFLTGSLPLGLPHTILADSNDPDVLGREAGRALREQFREHLIDEHGRDDLIRRGEAS